MVPLDVVVVIARWSVWWVKIDQVIPGGAHLGHVTAQYAVDLAVAEYHTVVYDGVFLKMFTERKTQIAPTIIVAEIREGKHSTRLLSGGCQHEGRDRQGSFV